MPGLSKGISEALQVQINALGNEFWKQDFHFFSLAKHGMHEMRGAFPAMVRDLLLWFEEGQKFFSRQFMEVAPVQAQVSLVLTDFYLMARKSITTFFSSSAGRLIHCFFLEQLLGILWVRIYFPFQQRAAVGHLANAGAIPHSRGVELWSFGIPEAFWSCRSFIMPRLVCRPVEPRALFCAGWDWKLQGRCNSSGVRSMEMERKSK